MPPRRTARTGAVAPVKPTADDAPVVNGTGTSTASSLRKSIANASKGTTRGRAKKADAPSQETVTLPPTKAATAGRGRPKKAETPAPTAASAKRKKDDESEEEPEPQPKKAKVKATRQIVEMRPKPKGPRRVGGKKTEINALRYTELLKVFVFGEGSSGELGLGATKKAIDVKRPRFNELLSNMNVVKIATGGMHVVALTKDNKLLTWGVNDNGALGRDTSGAEIKLRDADDSDSDSEDETGGLNELESTPTAVSAEHFPEDTVFVDIAAGDSCSFVLTTEGAVYGWGTFRKNEGVLGFARSEHTARTPQYIDMIRKVTQIACGTNHVLALDKDRHVYAWGNGQQNQLGRRVTERTLTESLLPNRVGFHDTSVKRPSQRIAKIACGDYHSLAIGEDGHIWSWGANNYCETGYVGNAGEDNASVLTPRIIHSLENLEVEAVEGGSHHTIAITRKGEVLIWGRCDGSQTGIPADQLDSINDDEKLLKSNGKPKILIQPTVIPNLKNIVIGSCGPEHTIVIDKNGKAYSWGFSVNYQTGQGTDDDVEIPTMIDNTAVRDTKLTFAGAGGQYSILASKK
ncbi:regulator of chromosome condensation 1/beta-lactamase-inhibitor protein II [Massariosphaeria phaeospora]|uniref:Regulator of chromosome condensation 1/beta-lactamase-inhibitor protein II n=1 Tax=Massariosphaeria phaeospora TaxID=100035 RepID=A0A7C8M2P8_9PLEO|nr:regulator of chromosome condensation 1/beta-lactamase-inhibitor protein II [Massariosphaeria phaeospora]